MDQEAIQVGFTSDWVTQSILLLILRKLQSFLVAVQTTSQGGGFT